MVVAAAEAEAATVAEAVKAAVAAVVPQLAPAAVGLVAEVAVEWEGAEVETVAAAALEQVLVMQA